MNTHRRNYRTQYTGFHLYIFICPTNKYCDTFLRAQTNCRLVFTIRMKKRTFTFRLCVECFIGRGTLLIRRLLGKTCDSFVCSFTVQICSSLAGTLHNNCGAVTVRRGQSLTDGSYRNGRKMLTVQDRGPRHVTRRYIRD